MITVTIILLYSLTLFSKQQQTHHRTIKYVFINSFYINPKYFFECSHDHDIIMIRGIMRTKNNREER